MQNLSRKYLILTLLGISTIILVGIFAPKIIESYYSNWNSEFKQVKISIAERVNEKIRRDESTLTKLSNEIVKEIVDRNIESNIEFLEVITSDVFKDVSINIFNSDEELVGWNKDRLISNDKLNSIIENYSDGEVFFLKTPLMIYLSKIRGRTKK